MADQSLREALAHLPRMVVFAELARQGSFRATAQALGLSPSTVTHHIQALEEALDVRLVERTSRTMTLTAAGAALLADADDMVRSWRRGTSTARRFAAAPTGNLVVTAPDVVAEEFVVPAVHQMLAENLGVTVQLRVVSKNLDLVAEGIDVAVRLGPLSDSGYGARALCRGHYGIYADPELAATWQPDHPSALAGAPWLQFMVRTERPELIGPGDERYALHAEPRVWVSSGGTLMALLCAGSGFALVPEHLAARECAAGRLVRVLPDWTTGPADFFAVTPSPRPTDAKVLRFIEILVDVASGR